MLRRIAGIINRLSLFFTLLKIKNCGLDKVGICIIDYGDKERRIIVTKKDSLHNITDSIHFIFFLSIDGLFILKGYWHHENIKNAVLQGSDLRNTALLYRTHVEKIQDVMEFEDFFIVYPNFDRIGNLIINGIDRFDVTNLIPIYKNVLKIN